MHALSKAKGNLRYSICKHQKCWNYFQSCTPRTYSFRRHDGVVQGLRMCYMEMGQLAANLELGLEGKSHWALFSSNLLYWPLYQMYLPLWCVLNDTLEYWMKRQPMRLYQSCDSTVFRVVRTTMGSHDEPKKRCGMSCWLGQEGSSSADH